MYLCLWDNCLPGSDFGHPFTWRLVCHSRDHAHRHRSFAALQQEAVALPVPERPLHAQLPPAGVRRAARPPHARRAWRGGVGEAAASHEEHHRYGARGLAPQGGARGVAASPRHAAVPQPRVDQRQAQRRRRPQREARLASACSVRSWGALWLEATLQWHLLSWRYQVSFKVNSSLILNQATSCPKKSMKNPWKILENILPFARLMYFSRLSCSAPFMYAHCWVPRKCAISFTIIALLLFQPGWTEGQLNITSRTGGPG